MSNEDKRQLSEMRCNLIIFVGNVINTYGNYLLVNSFFYPKFETRYFSAYNIFLNQLAILIVYIVLIAAYYKIRKVTVHFFQN